MPLYRKIAKAQKARDAVMKIPSKEEHERSLKVSKMPKKDDAMKRLDFVLKIREAEKLEVVFETGKKVLCPVCQLLKITDGKVLIYATRGSIRYCACKICKTLFNATGPAVEKKEKRKCLKCNTYRVFGRKIYCKKCLKENKKNTWRNYYLNKKKMNEN